MAATSRFLSRQFRRFAWPALLLALACVPAAAGDAAPLDRAVKLDLWDATLETFAQEIEKQTSVKLAFYRPDFAQDKEKKGIYLVTGTVSLRLAMECISRRFGCRYRLSEHGRLELSMGYDWIGDKDQFVVRFNELDGLFAPDGDMAPAVQSLREFLRVLPLMTGNFSFTIEDSPAPEGQRKAKAVTILPAVLADYFDKAVRCLKTGNGDLAQTGNPSAGSPQAKTLDRAPWSQLLAAEIELTAGNTDPHGIMREICDKVDIAFMLNGKPDAGQGRSGLLSGNTTFGRATEELSNIFALPRRVFLNPGAVIFEPGKAGEWEEDCKTREFFWTGLAVAGFEARRQAENLGPETMLARLRQEVFPQVWLDPMCALSYNPVSGRLAVMAPANVVEAVAVALKSL